jgi:hypothetical protein
MSVKKHFILPAALVAALAVGALSGCTSSTSESSVETTSTPDSGVSVEVNPAEFEDLPKDIPFLDEYRDAKQDGDQATGDYTLDLTTDEKDAVQEAAKKLVAGGFIDEGDNVYTNSSWKITLSGSGGTVKYTIAKA